MNPKLTETPQCQEMLGRLLSHERQIYDVQAKQIEEMDLAQAQDFAKAMFVALLLTQRNTQMSEFLRKNKIS